MYSLRFNKTIQHGRDAELNWYKAAQFQMEQHPHYTCNTFKDREKALFREHKLK